MTAPMDPSRMAAHYGRGPVPTLPPPRRYPLGAPPPLPWAKWWQRRCKAVKEPIYCEPFGRCDLRAGHRGDHALERGFDTPRWSTRWTA